MPKLLPRKSSTPRARERGRRMFVGVLTAVSGLVYQLVVGRGCWFRIIDANGDVVEDRREPHRLWPMTIGSACVVAAASPEPPEAVAFAEVVAVAQDCATTRVRLRQPWLWGADVVVMPMRVAPARRAA